MNGSPVSGFTKSLHKLMEMRWEGNVRELKNLMERAVVLTSNSLIDEKTFLQLKRQAERISILQRQSTCPICQTRKRYINFTLGRRQKDKAAQILGINRRTLYRAEGVRTSVSDHPRMHRMKVKKKINISKR